MVLFVVELVEVSGLVLVVEELVVDPVCWLVVGEELVDAVELELEVFGWSPVVEVLPVPPVEYGFSVVPLVVPSGIPLVPVVPVGIGIEILIVSVTKNWT